MLNKRNNLTLVAVILIAASQTLSAQSEPVSVTVRIVDVLQQPLAGDVTVLQGKGHVKLMNYRAEQDGVARIEIDRSERAVVVAKADGYVSREAQLTIYAGDPAPALEFVLARSSVVTGRIVESSGGGVPGATVRVGYPGESRAFMFGQESGEFRTDEFGYFRLPFVARGKPFVVEVASDDWLPAFSAQLTASGERLGDVTVTVDKRGGVLRGKVVDNSGTALSGVYVRLQASGGEEGYSPEIRDTRTVRAAANRRALTSADGSFEFRGVPAGAAVLVAGRPGARLIKTELLITRGETSNLTVRVP